MTPNPFETLQLDPSATDEAVVRRAAQLRQQGADVASLSSIRQAVQALTGRPDDRLLHSLLAPPAPVYDHSTVERFAAAHRRPPRCETNSEQAAPAELDLDEFATLLRPLLMAELAYTPLPLEPLEIKETPHELLRQTVEALWHGLPFDTVG